MGAPAVVDAPKPTIRIRGTAYPVLLPSVRDPRLHLAAVIVTLQVLGQTSFVRPDHLAGDDVDRHDAPTAFGEVQHAVGDDRRRCPVRNAG